MTVEECVQELRKRGFHAELQQGVPYIPQDTFRDFSDKKRFLEVCQELHLAAHIWKEGVFIGHAV